MALSSAALQNGNRLALEPNTDRRAVIIEGDLWDLLLWIRGHDQVVDAVREAGHVDPLTLQGGTVDVTASGGNALVGAAVTVASVRCDRAVIDLRIKHAKPVLGADVETRGARSAFVRNPKPTDHTVTVDGARRRRDIVVNLTARRWIEIVPKRGDERTKPRRGKDLIGVARRKARSGPRTRSTRPPTLPDPG